MSKLNQLTFLFAAAALAASASAQSLPDAERAPGGQSLFFSTPISPVGSYLALGDQIGTPIDVGVATAGNTGGLGVEHAWGFWWVSCRGNGASTAAPHSIYQLDAAGNMVGRIDQVHAIASAWGHRDLAADEAANKLWGGHESGAISEYNYNPGTQTLSYSGNQYTLAGSASGTIRALAFRKSTNSFFTANFNTGFDEFNLTAGGTVLNSAASSGKALYGLAYDSVNDKCWGFSQNNVLGKPTTCGTGCDLVEFNDFDLTPGASFGVPLGTIFDGTYLNAASTNIAGGCDIYLDPLNPGFLTIAGLHQYTSDSIYSYDLAVPAPGAGSFTTYCTAKVNSLGCTPMIGGVGNPSATAASGFKVNTTMVRNNKSGLFFYKVNGAQANVPFQGGTLCVGPSGIRRTPAQSAGGNPNPANDCSGIYSLDFNAFAQGAAGGNPDPALKVMGNVYHTQSWGRDQGFPAPQNTTLSNGLEVTIGM